jgi:pantothenate synthetase
VIVSEKTAEIRELLDGHRRAGRRVAMVGTSGGTHAGHLSLVRQAKRDCDVVAVFWNGALRLEWAPGTVQSYTRDLERDSALLEAAGTDLLYVPLRHDLYERPSVTFVEMPAMTAHLAGMPEGATMNILVTMVLTLLNIAGPCTTYFGEPADIAAAAVYLASDEAKYVTGTLLTVDGGATSHQPVPEFAGLTVLFSPWPGLFVPGCVTRLIRR